MKHEAINSPVELVPFADLYVSPLNPRTVFSAEGIEALAENIRQLGLIQNLAGLRDEAGKVGIVAGGRRLRALALLQDDPRFAVIPVKLAPIRRPPRFGHRAKTTTANSPMPPTKSANMAPWPRGAFRCRPLPSPSASPKRMFTAA